MKTSKSHQPNQPQSVQKKQQPGQYLSKLQWTFFGIAFGVIGGYYAATHATDFMAGITPTLITIGFTLTVVLILLLIGLPHLINYYIKRYTGKKVDVESFVGDMQSKSTDISIALSDALLINTDPKIKANIQEDLPKVLYYLIFSRLRNTGLRFLMTVFAAVAGLMGTILLYNQNQLLTGQNELLIGQNGLLNNQNEKIDIQIQLEEASRRSSLNFLMANVLDKIDEELKDPKNSNRNLSPQLISRISSLCQSFQPYRFMDEDTICKQPLSPERGSFLLAIAGSKLDTIDLKLIYQTTLFEDAFLKGAVFDSCYLEEVMLLGANLNGVYLANANLKNSDLSYSTIIDGYFHRANLLNAGLSDCNLTKADFSFANLSGADFTDSNLKESNLRWANIKEAKGITSKQLLQCYSLYETRGIPDSILTIIKQKKPSLLEAPRGK
jgi:uncharacterized protein YjbI with pentapeptide repeats